jgi:hypothetical protein
MRTYADFDGTPLSPEQSAALESHLNEAITEADESTRNGFGADIVWSGAPLLRPSRESIQRFVVFGSVAYEILAPFWERCVQSERAQWEYVPVLVDGQAVAWEQTEGESGVLHVMRRHVDGVPAEWLGVWLPCGWLTTNEVAHVSGHDLHEQLSHERHHD